MTFFKDFVLLMILFHTNFSKMHLNEHFQIRQSMVSEIKHLTTYTKSLNGFGTCNLIYSENIPICLDTFSLYTKMLLSAKVMVKTTPKNNNTIPDFILDTKSTETILFISEVSRFNYTFQNFVSSKFFKNAGKYKIVICGDNITEDRVLYDLAKYVWSHGVLKFVFIYYDTKCLKEAQYNPFFDKLYTVRIKDINEDYEEYPDKLKNMNGYPLKVLGKHIFTLSLVNVHF